MLPIPIMLTETLASCAGARQTGAAKTIDANRDRFIMHQIILAPLARTLKVRLSRKSSDRVVYIEDAATNDARKARGTIEGSVNVDSLHHHHELGCSVTNDGGVMPFYRFHL